MSDPENTIKVPGHNNATYGPVPKAQQLFYIELFEIAPSPITVDRVLFQRLRGEILLGKVKDPDNLDKLLAAATLSIAVSAIFENGRHEDPRSYTIPLRTTGFGDMAHLSIRNAKGEYLESLSHGRHDILSDCLIPGLFLRTGTWTFEAVARLGDGACLFAITLTQWLEGQREG